MLERGARRLERNAELWPDHLLMEVASNHSLDWLNLSDIRKQALLRNGLPLLFEPDCSPRAALGFARLLSDEIQDEALIRLALQRPLHFKQILSQPFMENASSKVLVAAATVDPGWVAETLLTHPDRDLNGAVSQVLRPSDLPPADATRLLFQLLADRFGATPDLRWDTAVHLLAGWEGSLGELMDAASALTSVPSAA
jgi:hypothetical protein